MKKCFAWPPCPMTGRAITREERGYEYLASITGLSRWRALVAYLPLMKRRITAKSRPNKNNLVGV